MSDALRPLVGDALCAALHMRRDDELDLGDAIVKTRTVTPTRQKVTLYSWGRHGKQLQGMLQKYLRMPSSIRGVVVEERVWHGLSTTPPAGDLAQGLRSLIARGEGIVVVLDEPNQRRAIVYDMEHSIYKIMEQIDWIKHHKKAGAWLISEHRFSQMEAWWWMYLNQPEVRVRIAASKNIELILF